MVRRRTAARRPDAALVSFWSSVVLKAGTYRGNPIAAHRAQPIRGEHFHHWLAPSREPRSK